MSRESLGLGPELQKYLLSVSLREHDTLAELREFTASRSDSNMQIAPEQGQFMAFLLRTMGARRVLEVGTFTGYSTLVMAQALPEDGKITTLDINPHTAELAQQFWSKAGQTHKIEQMIGPALDSLKQLEGPYDLAFIDADKTSYDAYFEACLELLRPGGLLLLDNVLWSGRVADPESQDPDTQALRAINQKIHGDQRVDLSLLPLADGLTLARKR